MKPDDKSFRDIVYANFPKLDILKHYPYGDEENWSYWLCGDVNLKKVHLMERNKGKTDMDYVTDIMRETARAMHYMVLHHGNFDPTDSQTIIAFGLWELFDSGWAGWNKKLTKGKTLDEIIALEKEQAKRISMVRFGYVGGKDPEPNTKEYKEAKQKSVEANRKEGGVYEVKHYPLLSQTRKNQTRKPLYTKQQLAAISLMVDCEFENLC
jgi:hypothetical protein